MHRTHPRILSRLENLFYHITLYLPWHLCHSLACLHFVCTYSDIKSRPSVIFVLVKKYLLSHALTRSHKIHRFEDGIFTLKIVHSKDGPNTYQYASDNTMKCGTLRWGCLSRKFRTRSWAALIGYTSTVPRHPMALQCNAFFLKYLGEQMIGPAKRACAAACLWKDAISSQMKICRK